MPNLHLGWSEDALSWKISNDPIKFTGGDAAYRSGYGYDPRVCRIGADYFITWCADYHGPTIGVAKTRDFRKFERLENAFLPNNRNGVLFPPPHRRKVRHAQPSQ